MLAEEAARRHAFTVAACYHTARMPLGEPDIKRRLSARPLCGSLIAHGSQWDAGSATGAIDSALHVAYIHLTTYLLVDVDY
jgi:hypothetical protein